MADFLLTLVNAILAYFKTNADPIATPLPMPAPENEGSASFVSAAKYTGVDEGGYSNDPQDSGGPTNKGITQKDLTKYLGRPATIEDVKNITTETAHAIYKKEYWDIMNLDRCVDQNIATPIFDMGLLCGTGRVAGYIQTICKVKVDYKIGPITLAALNSMSREVFVPLFVARCKERFIEIVKKVPKDEKYFNGWNARADRLLAFAHPLEAAPQSPVTSGSGVIGAGLVSLASKAGQNITKMSELISYQKQSHPGSDPRYWAMFNITSHSKNKRFVLYDRVDNSYTTFYAAHGKNSDPNYTGLATIFSNKNGSNCSSLGIYRCAETYMMSGHGRALRLDGKSSTNSNARARGIVLHGALGYVSDAFVAANGKCGRSLGCPSMDPTKVQPVIDKLIGGSLIYFY